MNGTPHRIRSLRWQVGAGSAAEAFAWRALLHDKGTELLLPVLEQSLDETAPGGRVIRIPKLELSIKLNSEGELETALPGRIRDQLRERLQCLLTADGAAGQPSAGAGNPVEHNRFETRRHIRETDRSPAGQLNDAQEKDSSGQRDASVGHNRFEILWHYLQTGRLHWTAAIGSASEQAAGLSETCRQEWPQILGLLKNSRAAAPFYFRLLQLLSADDCSLPVQILSDAIPNGSRLAFMQCLALLQDRERERFSRYTRLNLMAGMLAECAGGPAPPAPGRLLKAAAAAVPPQERQQLQTFIAALPAPAAALFRPVDFGTVRTGTAPETVAARPPDSVGSAPEGALPARDLHPGLTAEQGETPPGIACQFSSKRPAQDLFPLPVQQAGLVLLHPWLARFFENCGVKQVGNPELQPFALPRAAALLHFLATGREELYEYELGLVKILLGQHPETQLPVCDGLLTADDIEEVEALLQAALEHWSTLKNTSIQGLRSSFIERQGLLRQEESGWKLNVERKPYDMLLDQLPWGISIVKLPWMPRAIFSEW